MKTAVFDAMERCTPEEVQRLLLLVPEQQRTAALRYRHVSGQFAQLKSYLMLHGLLEHMQLVSPSDELLFDIGPHGKPSLKQYPNIHFNISHCRNAIAVAVDSNPVGIDVESYTNPSESLLRYTMSDSEQQFIQHSLTPERDFTVLWTRKEALFKYRGTGIVISQLHTILNQPDDVDIDTSYFDDKRYALTLVTQRTKETPTSQQ